MDKQMIASWNRVVSEDDMVFHLGDVGLYPLLKTKDIIKTLNGKKILIMGNNDNYLTLSECIKFGFDELYKYNHQDSKRLYLMEQYQKYKRN